MTHLSLFLRVMCDKNYEVSDIQIIYTKPVLEDLSQGSRIVFVRQLVSFLNYNGDRSTNLIGRDLMTPEEVKQVHYNFSNNRISYIQRYNFI